MYHSMSSAEEEEEEEAGKQTSTGRKKDGNERYVALCQSAPGEFIKTLHGMQKFWELGALDEVCLELKISTHVTNLSKSSFAF